MKLKIILSKTKGKLLKGYYNSKMQQKEKLIENVLKNTQVSNNEIVFEVKEIFQTMLEPYMNIC